MQTLATRCPDCGTSFRVQAAQLAASQGFVRCGRCDAVFDARTSLFDLATGEAVASPEDTTAPPVMAVAPSPASSAPEATAPEPVAAAQDDTAWPATTQDPRWIDTVAPSAPDPRAEPQWDEQDRPVAAPPDPAFEELPPEAVNERLRALLGGGESNAAASAWSSLAPAPDVAANRPPGARAAVWLLLAALTLALPVQWAWTERAALRARWPGLDHAWRQACPSCEHPAWARLDGLSVGASSLQPTPQGQAYQLKLSLHNRNAFAVALPWVDLRLQDAQGRLVLRRALSPQELGANSDRLPAGAQLPLVGNFLVVGGPGAQGISGYEVALFHP